MKRTITTILGAILLTAGGQALAAGPPVAPVGLNAGLGCSVQCIETALVTPTMTGGTLRVETDTPARIAVKVSDQAPGFIDGTPWIPNPDYFGQTWNSYSSFTFELDGLAAGTLQHILVTATDADGHVASRLGTFRTLDPPPLPPAVEGNTLKVTFFKVKILNDADKPGKGEILLSFKVGDDVVYSMNDYKKLNSGQTYRPPLESHTVSVVAGRKARLQVDGVEHDGNDSTGIGNDHSNPFTLVDPTHLEGQVYGDDYGGMPYGHDAYVVFESEPRDYLEFRVYAWIDVSG
jgi:hypothetical protein